MLAVKADDPTVLAEILTAFRTQADASLTGPKDLRSHRDGWGFAGRLTGFAFQFARSVLDASSDPEYPIAVRRASVTDPGTFFLAHVRNASVGGTRLENTHPFVRRDWMFAHNGTIHGLEVPPGHIAQGDTDSERFFLHILDEYRRTRDMTVALRTVLPRIARRRNSSLTFLLTDGRDLYAFRSVGSDVGTCKTKECQLEHYALSVGTWKGATVALQEPAILPGFQTTVEVPPGQLCVMPRNGSPRLIPVLGGAFHLPGAVKANGAAPAPAATPASKPRRRAKAKAAKRRTR